MSLRSVELFPGAGGLALGLSSVGFEHLAVVETDEVACETLSLNATRLGIKAPVVPIDARDFLSSLATDNVDLLAAGVPCQPFSRAGRLNGFSDSRNLFPIVLNAIRLLRPRAVVIENVPGLTHVTFRSQFQYLLRQLGSPDSSRKRGEGWTDHARRLNARRAPPAYFVNYGIAEAADYGVPQLRQRLVIVAYRADIGHGWS